MHRVYTWVAFVLAAWLPLQAVAVPLLTRCCPDEGRAAVIASAEPCHEHAITPDASAAAEDQRGDPAAGSHPHDGDHGDNPGHLCCPQYSGAPVYRFHIGTERAGFDAPAGLIAARSHVPDQPQRPPRA